MIYEPTLEVHGNAAQALIDAARLINSLAAAHGYAEITDGGYTVEIAYLAVGPNLEAVWTIEGDDIYCALFTDRDAARATFTDHVESFENDPDFYGWDQRTGWAV